MINGKSAVSLNCLFGNRLNAANAFAVLFVSVTKLFYNGIFIVHNNIVAVKNSKRIVAGELSCIHKCAACAVHRLLTNVNDVCHIGNLIYGFEKFCFLRAARFKSVFQFG